MELWARVLRQAKLDKEASLKNQPSLATLPRAGALVVILAGVEETVPYSGHSKCLNM